VSVIVEDLTKIYGEQSAVDHISFSIKPGQITGFLGPNGAGKSTTMKMLTGYIMPSSGSATVHGIDVVKDSLSAKKLIGYLPENNPLYTEMYIKEYLRFIAGVTSYSGNVSQRINQLIELTGLGVEQHKKIGMLSKGYRQRVGIAQALFHDPKVLILDEPTSGLDPNQLVDIRALIADLGKEKTVILSTHIMQEVQALCQYLIIINKGKIVASDNTQVLLSQQNQSTAYQVQFKQKTEQKILLAINGLSTAESNNGTDWIITAAKGVELRDRLFEWAVSQNNPIYMLNPQQKNLESVFQLLTKTN